ncbi:hypothetical protein AAFC00_003739 [Neodothiora populina]|uniref:RGS domain-containing protein n=1 Tax=Neodothiora populina TaxID=2781224 RepID=A0ABR3PFA2_9PEZI
MIARKTSSISIDSVHSSKSPGSSVGDCDADDEGTMSMDESKSRPLSVVIPEVHTVEGPYCPRKPGLQEILANKAPAPWTLSAFMAYLSNNHCLETLEFTMDAGRYKKHYQRMMDKAVVPGEPSERDSDYVKELWSRLIEAYIQPNGSREVNLPSEVRDPIIRLTPSSLPPAPEILDSAVNKTYELMEESVLVPFLNSVCPLLPPQYTHHMGNQDTTHKHHHSDERSHSQRRSNHHSSRSSPPPHTAWDHSADPLPASVPNRKSAPSALTTAMSKHRFTNKLSPTSSHQSASLNTAISTSSGSETLLSGPSLTDDSGSSGSPTNDSPMTPPVSPPIGDLSSSPRSGRDSGAWKKLGRLSGWKPNRRRSPSAREHE